MGVPGVIGVDRHHGTNTARALYHIPILATHVSRRSTPNAQIFRDLPPDGGDRQPASSDGVCSKTRHNMALQAQFGEMYGTQESWKEVIGVEMLFY